MNTVVVGYVRKESWNFEVSATEIISFINGIEDGTITYETSCFVDFFYLFNLTSRRSFDVLQILVRHSTLPITLYSIENHQQGYNLLATTYNKWFDNWRSEAVQSSYDWRIAMEKFSEIRLHDVHEYLNNMLDVYCFTYDHTVTGDREKAFKEIERAKTFEREAELINSIGMIETEVKDGTIRIVKH